MTQIASKKNTALRNLLVLVIVLTNLSQLPHFVDEGMTRYLSYPAWILLFIYCLFKAKRPKLAGNTSLIIVLCIFIVLHMLLFTANPTYADSPYLSIISMSVFILIIGSCVGKDLDKSALNALSTAYIISTMVVAVDVYNTYIATAQQYIGTITYLYASKNSICQILLTAFILIIFTKFSEKSAWIRLFYICCLAVLAYEMIVLQSRATMLGIPVAIAIALFNGNLPKKVKYSTILLVLACVIMLFSGDNLDNFINRFIYAGRDGSNLDSISSGRAHEWENFGNLFAENPFFGRGRFKQESLILTALLEYGIVGGLLILYIAVKPLFFLMKVYNRYKSNAMFVAFVAITISYLINGFFEQQAPFGPGVKCYFLWFLYGIFSAKSVTQTD